MKKLGVRFYEVIHDYRPPSNHMKCMYERKAETGDREKTSKSSPSKLVMLFVGFE